MIVSNFFAGPSSATVTIPRAEASAEQTSAAVTPGKGASQQLRHLYEETRGKPNISGTSFGLKSIELDFLCILLSYCRPMYYLIGWILVALRTLPSFVTVHTFCASNDGLRNSGFLWAVPAITGIFFCTVYKLLGKSRS